MNKKTPLVAEVLIELAPFINYSLIIVDNLYLLLTLEILELVLIPECFLVYNVHLFS